MKTKIQPVSKTERIDYSKAIIQNIWHCKKEYFLDNKRNRIQDLINSSIGESVICILTEEFTDKPLLETLLYLTQSNPNDLRVYILVNSYSKELNSLSNHCLIRYEGLQIKGTFILQKNLSEKHFNGIFFTGRLTEQSLAVSDHLIFDIDEQDISKLYTHFCYLFWHSAKEEIIKEKNQKVTSRPLDVFHNPFEYDNRDYVYATLFNFSSQIPRGDLMNKHILYLNKETQIPILIQPESEKKLGDNILQSLLPKEEFQAQKPTLEDDGVSCSITYSWNNIPYYLPKNATEHTLYKEWKNKQDEIIKKLNAIQEKIEDAEKKENSISKKIFRLFLGKKNVFSKLSPEIDELKKVDYPNLPENNLKEKINRANEIYREVQGHAAEVEEENRKAKIDEEIEVIQNKIYEQKNELEVKEKKLKEKEEEQNNKIQKFCEKYNFNKDKLNSFEKELKSKKSSSKIKKEDLSRNLSKTHEKISKIEEAIKEPYNEEELKNFCKEQKIEIELFFKKNQWLNELNQIKEKLSEIEKSETMLSELDNVNNNFFAKKEKIIQEISKLNDEINSKKEKIKLNEKEFNHSFKEQLKKLQNVLDFIINKIEEKEESSKSIFEKIKSVFRGEDKAKLVDYKKKIVDFQKLDFNKLNDEDLKQIIDDINEIYKYFFNSYPDIGLYELKKQNIEEQKSIEKEISDKQNKIQLLEHQLEEIKNTHKSHIKQFCENYNLNVNEDEITKKEKEMRESIADKKNLSDKYQELNSIVNELKEIEDTKMEMLDKINNLDSFCKKHKIKNDLYNIAVQWIKEKDELEKKLKEIQDVDHCLQELEEINEDSTFVQKLKDDISKIEKQIKKYQNDIENKEKEKNKEVKPNEKTSALYELDSSSKSQANEKGIFVPMPNLPQLPQTGKLYQLGKESYLAIEFWEEYEQGKKEAERLKAKLCAIYKI